MPKLQPTWSYKPQKGSSVSRLGDCWLETSYKLSSPYADVWVAQGMTAIVGVESTGCRTSKVGRIFGFVGSRRFTIKR